MTSAAPPADGGQLVSQNPGGGSHLAREKRLVAVSSVIAAVFLTGFKLVVGLMTGSLGILSEALHSALDLAAAVMTLWAVRASGRPADGEHTYGHGKYENLSALFETVLLLVTCVWILYEAVQRLLFKHVAVESSVWGFVVMAVSIVIDVSRSRALMRVAKKSGSQALEADALHFSTDVWSSSVVIVGLVAVFLAPRVGAPWLVSADTVAAMMVAAIVVWVSIQLGRKSIGDLLDEAPPRMLEAVAAAVMMPGVVAVRRVRLRRSGPESFADVTLEAEPGTSLERGHAIADQAEMAVQGILPGADVVVHIEPANGEAPQSSDSPAAVVRRVAAAHALPVHDIHLQSVAGRLSLEMHVEVPGSRSVAQVHDEVSAFEAALRRALPRDVRIVTHLEPAESEEPEDTLPHGHFEALQAIHAVLARLRHLGTGHDLKLSESSGGLALSLHWTVPEELPLAQAHARTEEVERALRERLPALGRVVIHVEPTEQPDPGPRAPGTGE